MEAEGLEVASVNHLKKVLINLNTVFFIKVAKNSEGVQYPLPEAGPRVRETERFPQARRA